MLINQKQFIFSLMVMVLIMVSCNSNSRTIPTSEPTSLPTRKATIEPTPSPQRTMLGTPTPFPTISLPQMEEFIYLLQSDSCKLPCFLNIVPGETTFTDAVELLEGMGASNFGGIKNENFSSQLYLLPLNDDKYNVWPITHINLSYGKDNIVYQIDTSVGLHTWEYWKNYSMSSIFVQLGEPDDIYSKIVNYDDYTAFHIIIIYNDPGIVVELSGTSELQTVCPELHNVYQLELTLTDPSSGLDIITGGPAPEEQWYWSPIEDVSGMTKDEYYKQVLMNDSTCFELIGSSESYYWENNQ